MAPSIQAAGLTIRNTVKVHKSGKMAPNTKAIGSTINHMDKGNFGLLMEMYIMEIGKMIKQMVTES